MLEVRNLRKVYGEEPGGYVALEGISIDIAAGEFLCLLGPSGCGKSTLLNILAGFEEVSAGSVMFDGRPVKGADRDRMMFFQDAGSALLPWLTVEENVRFALRARRVPRSQWDDIITRYLSMVDLNNHRTKFPAELSGGMRQRLQIARALAVEPRVLLMDEPFAALDAMIRRRMHAILTDIWQRSGQTIVFVTHDIAEAIALADRIAIMSVGPCSSFMKIMDVKGARPRDMGDPASSAMFAEIERLLTPEIRRSEERLG
ncbi:ABC transporter ATP-binding protein [Ancylobacter sp. MQZ15Z-1]|uniref:ABC transporter ATP-binding protein n=1 Tax=Ancylobacter mangrovi TaxID=2972472 RepID=A0A9X2T4U7_9HYPH|nr:ABC transporter ATP-binding protein [Ancylobacter mangrovi]MCS0494739.1 ABC transporter ATP-binding protein [Ancylobacter mangrovi]